jgi:hypothetical protein
MKAGQDVARHAPGLSLHRVKRSVTGYSRPKFTTLAVHLFHGPSRPALVSGSHDSQPVSHRGVIMLSHFVIRND